VPCWRRLGLQRVGGGDGLVGMCGDERWWAMRCARGEGGGTAGDAVEGGEDAGDEGGVGEVGAEDKDLVEMVSW